MMEIINVTMSDLRGVTKFLIHRRMIFHPLISPNGIPDFKGYYGRRITVILDRQILVKTLNLVENGFLKSELDLKIVSAFLFWVKFNDVSVTPGLAYTEHANFKKDNIESKMENDKFKSIFEQYSPQCWIDLYNGKIREVPKIKLSKNESQNFYIESEHFKMHYLELLKIYQLMLATELSVFDRFREYNSWVYENILIGQYSTCYSILAFKGRAKIFSNISKDFDDVIKKCRNQAWDLTYLSIWSIYYFGENASDQIHLFATEDKELKEVFILTHQFALDDLLNKFYDKNLANKISKMIRKVIIPREHPKIDSSKLDEMILKETLLLKEFLKRSVV